MAKLVAPFAFPFGGDFRSSTLDTTYTFSIKNNLACWDGTLSTFETSLLNPITFSSPVELFKSKLMQFSIAPFKTKQAARAILQMATETELFSVLAEYIFVSEDIKKSNICERRKYLPIDKDILKYKHEYIVTLQTLLDVGYLSKEYYDLFEVHLNSNNAHHRVSSMCVLMCYSAFLNNQLVENVIVSPMAGTDYVITKADTASVSDGSTRKKVLALGFEDSYSFSVVSNSLCWNGTLSAFEISILTPFSLPGLENTRSLLVQNFVDNSNNQHAARAILQSAFDTEVSSLIAEYIPVTKEILSANICNKRKYIDVDTLTKTSNFYYAQALNELFNAGVIPNEYTTIFDRYIKSESAKYRISAVSAMICYAVKMKLDGAVL